MKKSVINKILLAYGTRPEIIKISPIIKELEIRNIPYKTIFTGQHKELYEDVKELVPTPDFNLSIMKKNQSLNDIITSTSFELPKVLISEKPDLLMVQGDTTTVVICSLLAFYQKIPIGHIEAGLRTYNLNSPYPEEANRQIVSRIATYNWAPTKLAEKQLHDEKVNNIILTGNTVVDACKNFQYPISYNNQILITLHRRENFGEKMKKIFEEIEFLAIKHSDLQFIFPMHPNPNVQDLKPILKHVNVIKPLGYVEMMRLLSNVKFVISDSGGLQEECASFKKKIIVCRDTTERPEGLDAGFAKLVNTNVIDNFSWANDNPDWDGENPYGKGDASRKIIDSFI